LPQFAGFRLDCIPSGVGLTNHLAQNQEKQEK